MTGLKSTGVFEWPSCARPAHDITRPAPGAGGHGRIDRVLLQALGHERPRRQEGCGHDPKKKKRDARRDPVQHERPSASVDDRHEATNEASLVRNVFLRRRTTKLATSWPISARTDVRRPWQTENSEQKCSDQHGARGGAELGERLAVRILPLLGAKTFNRRPDEHRGQRFAVAIEYPGR